MRLITKSYPSLVDIYVKTEVYNEELGSVTVDWDYDNPITIPCNVTSLSPDNSLEQFGVDYSKRVFVKIEYLENVILFTHQAGNLRSKDGSFKYYFVNDNEPGNMLFNVSGINTQIDAFGNLVGYVAYLELAEN